MSGAEGLVVVLFWLDLWEIFFLATPGFEQGTSGSLDLHSTTAPRQLLFSPLTISGNSLWCRGIGGGIVLIGPGKIFFLYTLGLNCRPLGLQSSTLPLHHGNFWCTPVTISGNYVECIGIGGGIVLIGPVRDFLFGHTRVWTGNLWISTPALYHCAMAISCFNLRQFQVFNSGAEGLVVVLFWFVLWEIFF